MAGFTNSFLLTDPKGSDAANALDDYIRLDTKTALDERYSLEHISLATGVNDDVNPLGQGRHKAGFVGVVGLGDLAAMGAITTPGTGALFISTEADLVKLYPEGQMYRYDIVAGTGWDPVQLQKALYATGAEVETGTLEDKAISPVTLRQADTEYVKLESGTLSLSQNGIGPFVYNIAEFNNIALTVDQDNIRAIHVLCLAGTAGLITESYTTCTYPDDTPHKISSISTPTGFNIIIKPAPAIIPVNKGQVDMTFLQSGFGDRSFTIIGATQRTYAE